MTPPQIPEIEWRKISTVSSASLAFETWEYFGEYVHIVKVLASVKPEDRFPYEEDHIRMNKTGNFFRLLDNSVGQDSLRSYDEMIRIGELMRQAGIKRAFNAIVTHDAALPSVAKLLTAVAEIMQIETEIFSTTHYDEALDFMKKKVEEVAGGK